MSERNRHIRRAAWWCALLAAAHVAADDFALAERAFRDGLFDVAAGQLEDVLAAEPRNIEARVLLGRCHYETGAWSNSLAYLSLVDADAAPPHLYAEAQYWCGRIYEHAGDAPKALFAYEAAAGVTQRVEYSGRAALAAAQLYLRRKDTMRARIALSNCLHGVRGAQPSVDTLFTLSQCELADGNGDAAHKVLEQAAAANTNATLAPHLQCGLAIANLVRGLTNEAVAAFSSLQTDATPESVRAVAQWYLACNALAQGKTNTARALLATVAVAGGEGQAASSLVLYAADGFPQAEALYLGARLDAAAGKTRDARDAFETCATRFPSSSVGDEAALAAALASVLLGDTGRATQHLHRLVATARPAVRTASLLHLGDIERATSNFPAALGHYAAAYAQDSNSSAGAEALFRTGVAQYELGNFVMAQKTFDSVVNVSTGAIKDDAHFWATWSLVEQGLPAEARKLFNEYLIVFPDGRHAADVRLELARLAYQLGDCKGALEHYTRIASNTEDAARAEQAAYELGWVCIGLGRQDDAIAQFSRFVTTYSNSPLSGDVEYYLGETFFNLNDYERARSAFLAVAEKHPTGSFAAASAYWAALAAYRLDRHDDCAAVLSAHWARIAGSAEWPAATMLRGDCARAQHALANALDAYRAVWTGATDSYLAVEAQFRAGDCLLDMSNAAEATTLFTTLTSNQFAANRAKAWLSLGDARHAAGDRDAAIASWLRVIYDCRDYPALCNDAIDRAGRLYKAMGEPKRARQVYRLRAEIARGTLTNTPPQAAPHPH